MSAEEEVRSDFNPVRNGSPLPWLLLGITLTVGVTLAIVSHQRMLDEKTRTARALQANDEVMGRLRGVVAENQRLREEAEGFAKEKAELQERHKRMEDQLRSSADEMAKILSNPRCVKR